MTSLAIKDFGFLGGYDELATPSKNEVALDLEDEV
jgi:hypothetical protein